MAGNEDGGAPAAPTGQPQAGNAAAAPAAPQAGAPADGPDVDVVVIQDLPKLRSENQALRTRLKAAEETERLRAEAEMSEAQKLQKKIKELEADRETLVKDQQAREIKLAAITAATKLNFRDPALAESLIDQDLVEFTESGTPKNVEQLLKRVLEKHPYLAKTAGAGDFGGGPRGQAPSDQPTMNDLLRAAVRKD